MLIILLGLLPGHRLCIILNVGSGGTRFCIDIYALLGDQSFNQSIFVKSWLARSHTLVGSPGGVTYWGYCVNILVGLFVVLFVIVLVLLLYVQNLCHCSRCCVW